MSGFAHGKKPVYQLLAASETRTATYTSRALEAKTEPGILVIMNVTAASGTGGLTLRINAREPDYSAGASTPWAVPLNNAPAAVTTTGTFTYLLYPGATAIAGGSGQTQATDQYLPRDFTISVAHGDSSSYTYSIGFQLMPY